MTNRTIQPETEPRAPKLYIEAIYRRWNAPQRLRAPKKED